VPTRTIEITARDLCKLCSLMRQVNRTVVGAEHLKGDKTHTLTNLRPDVTARGNASVKRIGVVEDGHEKWYAGNYEFVVTAFIIDGERRPIPD
jgi:hypothetical protein